MNTIGKDRNFAIDFLKTIAIFLVVIYHFSNLNLNIFSGSIPALINYSFLSLLGIHVPLFFFINGFLLFNKKLDLKKHLYKTIRLLILTIIWSVVTLFAMMYINKSPLSFSDFITQLKTWQNGWIQHLWFIQQLFIVYILFPLLKSAYDKDEKKPLLFFVKIWGMMSVGNTLLTMIINIISCLFFQTVYSTGTVNFFQNFNPFPSSRSCSILYFILGGILLNSKNINRIISKKLIVIFMLLLSIGCTALYGIIISFTQESIYSTVGNGYLSPFTAIAVICIFILFYQFYKDKPPENKYIVSIFTIISQNTLGIYLTHMIIGKLLQPALSSLLVYKGIIPTLVFALINLFISLFIVIILKKIPVLKLLFKI